MITPDLLMIPSGWKQGKVYLQKPVDGAGDLTLVRATVKNRVRKDGLIEQLSTGRPAIDWLNVDCPFLSIEPVAINIVTDSEDIDSYFGTKTGVSVTDNNTMSPDGTQTADKIIENTATSTHLVSAVKNGLVDNASNYVYSVFLKQNGRHRVRLSEGDTSSYTIFNLDTGSIIGFANALNTSIEYYGNGWYRCAYTLTTVNTDFTPNIELLDEDNTQSYNGNGENSIWAWGVDLIKTDFVTSYIKTASGAATRNKDELRSLTNATLFNPKEGAFMVEIAAFGDIKRNSKISISDGTVNNRIDIGLSTVSQQIQSIIQVGGVPQATLNFIVDDVTDFNKIAVRYKLNDFMMAVNGRIRFPDILGTTFDTGNLNILRSDTGAGGSPFEGKIKRIEYYKTALSNDDLETITT